MTSATITAPQGTHSTDQMTLQYERSLLKLSGESFGEKSGLPFHRGNIDAQAREIDSCLDNFPTLKLAIVVGAGNICRGVDTKEEDDRTTRDYEGMGATILNAQELMNSLERLGREVRIMSAIVAPALAEPYCYRVARSHMQKGRIVILAGGLGHGFCTTDTAAVVRALELKCKIVLMAKNGTGGKVYNDNPKNNPHAKPYDTVTLTEAISRRLQIMDEPAMSLCRVHKMPIQVLDIGKKNELQRAVCGQSNGTFVKAE